MATYRAVNWSNTSEIVRARRLRHVVENAQELIDQKLTLAWVDNGAVTKYGLQSGYAVDTVSGSPTVHNVVILFNTTTDGVKFTATPFVGVYLRDPPSDNRTMVFVSACSTSQFTATFRQDNGGALANQDVEFCYLAIGPVGGI